MWQRNLGRYPGLKMIICGKSSADGGDPPQVLVKSQSRPSHVPEIDDLILLQSVQLKETWRNSQNQIPEAVVMAAICDRELSVHLPGPKRARDSLQRLGSGAGRLWSGSKGKQLECKELKRS